MSWWAPSQNPWILWWLHCCLWCPFLHYLLSHDIMYLQAKPLARHGSICPLRNHHIYCFKLVGRFIYLEGVLIFTWCLGSGMLVRQDLVKYLRSTSPAHIYATALTFLSPFFLPSCVFVFWHLKHSQGSSYIPSESYSFLRLGILDCWIVDAPYFWIVVMLQG